MLKALRFVKEKERIYLTSELKICRKERFEETIPLRCWNNSIRFFARRGESIFVHAVLLMVCVQRDILLGKFLQATEFLLQAKIFRYDNVRSLSKDVSSSVESFWGWPFVEKPWWFGLIIGFQTTVSRREGPDVSFHLIPHSKPSSDHRTGRQALSHIC